MKNTPLPIFKVLYLPIFGKFSEGYFECIFKHLTENQPITIIKAELKLSRALDDSTEIDWWFLPLTLFIPGFLAGVVLVVLHLHPVTPLFLKSGNKNFVQSYFEVGSIF